jgi:hypothetical protein
VSTKTILAILLAASLAGNASFLLTVFLKRPTQRAGAIDQLSLTTDQASRFEGAKRTFQNERARAQKRMAELRGVLADEFLKEAPDRQRLLYAAVEMAQVQTGMRPKLVDHLLALHAVLTPAQRASLADAMRTGGGAGAGCPGAMLYSNPEQGR